MNAELAIGLAALILSVVSLVWQSWTWARSGPILKVDVSNVITDGGRLPGDPEHYVCVKAVNVGRGPLTVASWGIELPDGRNYFVTRPIPISAPPQARLEPGESASYFVLAADLWKHAEQTGGRLGQMRPWVETASGTKRFSQKPVPLQ